MRNFLEKYSKLIGLVTAFVLVGGLISFTSNQNTRSNQAGVGSSDLEQVVSPTAAPGSKDPKTYKPVVIGAEKVTGFEKSDPIKESFVLVNVGSAKLSSALAVSDEAKVILEGSSGTTTIAVPASQVEEIKALDSSATVEENLPVSIFADAIQTPTPSWGLDRIDFQARTFDNSYKYSTTGAGVTIYVVDTGLNTSHSDFSGRILQGFSAINDGNGVEDCNGHGTHVSGSAAGTSYGVAKGARVVPVRVLNCNGSGYNSDIIAGINWILNTHQGGPAVINLSIGGGYSSILNSAIANASSRGFTVVAAAGNSSADACNFSPVSASGVIGVGASTSSDAFASYSNFGSCVDVIAPGSAITSAWIGSASARSSISGTSMASPHVAGLAARILEAGTGGLSVQAKIQELAVRDLISGLRSGTPNILAVWQLDPLASPSPTITTSPSPAPTKTVGRGSKTVGKAKNLTFTQVSDTQLQVNWAAFEPEVTNVLVEWFAKNNSSQTSSALVPSSNTSLVISNLVAGRPYEVRVTAISESGAAQVKGEPAGAVISLIKNYSAPSPTPSETTVAPSPTPSDTAVAPGTTTTDSTTKNNSPGQSGTKGNSKK